MSVVFIGEHYDLPTDLVPAFIEYAGTKYWVGDVMGQKYPGYPLRPAGEHQHDR